MKMKEESEKVDLKLNIQESKIMASVPITSWQIDGETMETVTDFILGAPKSLQMVIAAMKLKMLAPWKKSYDQPRQHIKKQRHHFVNKGPSSQGYGFSSSHVWLWELDYKQNWAWKNWCFWTVVLEKTLESHLDCKIKPVHPKGIQSWIFIGRTNAEAWKSNTLATWCKELPHWKKPWCWEWLKVGGEGDDRGWDGWMASPTQWTWVWVSSRSWWWTREAWNAAVHGVAKSRHDWPAELNWTVGVRKCSNFILLHVAVQFSQHHLLKRPSAPLYILASFVRNKVPIGAWAYFWAFCLVPFVYISVFVPIPYCLDDCSFVV